MFNIEFTTDTPEPQEDGWLGLWGRITLGDYSERFVAQIGYWQRTDYERQWLDAARRLVDGADRTAAFTDVYFFWWTMWREGERVYGHEEIITTDRYPGPYDGPVPYHIIENRITHTEEGDPVSEWELTMDDIRDFVRRRDASAVPA